MNVNFNTIHGMEHVRCYFFFDGSGDHRDLLVLAHSFPTRRSSDLSVSEPLPTLSRPWVGWSRPASRRSRVLLPQPLRPTTATNWPEGMRRSICLSRSEEHTSELQSLMRISHAVFCLNKNNSSRKHLLYAITFQQDSLIHTSY